MADLADHADECACRFCQERRLGDANELIEVIASCGRRFFRSNRLAFLELDARGRVWFHDDYSGRRIYTHYEGSWRGFTHGGTLKGLVECLREYVKRGLVMRFGFGPWPAWICGGDLWRYGEDMAKVREAALRLGILEPPWPYGPPDYHEECRRLHESGGYGFCDCKASDASDTEWGLGA